MDGVPVMLVTDVFSDGVTTSYFEKSSHIWFDRQTKASEWEDRGRQLWVDKHGYRSILVPSPWLIVVLVVAVFLLPSTVTYVNPATSAS
jgi:hypothetical protein